MKNVSCRHAVLVSVAALAGLSGSALAAGPDVTLLDIRSMSKFGPSAGLVGYAIGSHTCNIGDQNFAWTNDGTPGLGMNIYRLKNGRIEQLGSSWVKTACCAGAQNNGCGTCNGQGGSVLGAGCLDVYSSGFNAGQGNLKRRSQINSYSGAFTGTVGVSGTVGGYAQCVEADVNIANNATAQYFLEGVYVCTEENASSRQMNNATYKRATLGATNTLSPNPVTGGANVGVPAIQAWRDHGGGANVVDPSVTVSTVDVPSEGRFWYASKATNNNNGTWHYEYAVFNLNVNKGAGSFEVPVPAGVTVSNAGWRAPTSHSGEVYNNDAWTNTRTSNTLRFATAQTSATNANANAIRWGTMHNFWFDANIAPNAAQQAGSLGVFMAHTPPSVSVTITSPGTPVGCDSIDFDNDGVSPSSNDIDAFLNVFGGGSCIPCNDIDFNNDGVSPSSDDLDALLRVFAGGAC